MYFARAPGHKTGRFLFNTLGLKVLGQAAPGSPFPFPNRLDEWRRRNVSTFKQNVLAYWDNIYQAPGLRR
jgi:hypothetical protein